MTTEIEFRRTRQSPHIAYELAGRQGDTLVFLHGIGGNRHNWHDQLARFAPRLRAVALDLRGYGDSDPIPDGFEFTGFVDDVLAVLDELDAPRAHIVGLSMGGLVAQALYARAPERVASLALVACRSAAEPLLPPARREAFIRERLVPLREGGPEALAQSLAPTLIGRQATPRAREQVMASLRKVRPDSYLRVMEARMRIPPFLDLAQVRCPTLVMGSDEDKVAPPEQMRELAAAIPGAKLVPITGSGHLINIEQPDAFDAALDEFLRSVQEP